jgi:DNA gyrase inhibitor GyrI
MWWVIAGVVVLGAALSGSIVSNVEQPAYRILDKQGDIEIRDYPPMIVAETRTVGERQAAINEGFRAIADYIFGHNAGSRKVAMTAPVLQQSEEPAASPAAAGSISGSESGSAAGSAPTPMAPTANAAATWSVRFIMPAGSTMDNLPAPANPAVRLREVPGQRIAAIRFSGTADADSVAANTSALTRFIADKGLHALAPPTYAFYNPPWTLPFMRRNEVMIEVAR